MDDDAQKGLCFLSYTLMFITGIIIWVMFSPEADRVKFHSVQASVLGAIAVVAYVAFSIIRLPVVGALVLFLVWAYGMYIGFEAYCGHDVQVPRVTKFATLHSGYKPVHE